MTMNKFCIHSSHAELDEFLLELDEDVEGMQSTIYFLQQQLRQTRDQLSAVQKENELLRNTGVHADSVIQIEAHLPENLVDLDNSLNQRNEMDEPSYLQQNTTDLHSIVGDRCNGPVQPSFPND